MIFVMSVLNAFWKFRQNIRKDFGTLSCREPGIEMIKSPNILENMQESCEVYFILTYLCSQKVRPNEGNSVMHSMQVGGWALGLCPCSATTLIL